MTIQSTFEVQSNTSYPATNDENKDSYITTLSELLYIERRIQRIQEENDAEDKQYLHQLLDLQRLNEKILLKILDEKNRSEVVKSTSSKKIRKRRCRI